MDSDVPYEILILYASQTGRAQYVSEEISRELLKRDFSTEVLAMDDYDVTNLPNEKFVIFVAATTGQGDPPDNMKNFWRFLLIKDLPSDSLAGINFTVFGMGDSGYAKFNAVARRLYQRVLQLGAKEFHERGMGDDQHEFGYDTEFIPWLERLYESFKSHFSGKKYTIVETDQPPVPKYNFDLVEMTNGKSGKNDEVESLKYMKRNYCYNKNVISSKITVNKTLTAEDAVKEVRYIELELPEGSNLKYEPGDVAVLLPRNDPDMCKKLADRLGYKYDQYVKLSINPNQKSKKNPFPKEPIKISELFEYWLNLSEPPTRFFFRVLAYFTEDKLHKTKLREFGDNSSDGKIEYNNYCYREKRNVYEVLFDFDTVNIPLNYLLEGISLQKAREYSICTSQSQHPQHIGLTIAITQYFTPFKRQITGVCSQWLFNAPIGEIAPLWVHRGTLPYPNNVTIPAICVGPGTGVAPHLSFLEERVLALKEKTGYPVNTFLIFGNRNASKDFIHKDMMEKWDKDQQVKLLTAFSRDQEQKIYVYHKIKEHKKELADLMLNNKDSVRIFVCGNSKNMPKWVEETFVEILAEVIGVEQAKAFIQRMNNEKRYMVEAW